MAYDDSQLLEDLRLAKESAKGIYKEATNTKTDKKKDFFTGKTYYRQTADEKQATKDAKKALEQAELDYTSEVNVGKASDAIDRDIARGQANAAGLLGDNGDLVSIYDQQAVQDARSQMAAAADITNLRDQATRNLNAAEASNSRQLQSKLASSGVKGGLAGGALTDMSQYNLRNRAAMEQDLMLANQDNIRNLANFEVGLAQSDQATQNAEKAMNLQASLGLTGMYQAERSGTKQEYLNSLIPSNSGGK